MSAVHMVEVPYDSKRVTPIDESRRVIVPADVRIIEVTARGV